MATTFPIKSGVLQGHLDADGWGILNIDKTTLGLVKGDVGLGNVDNTSDANKPVSTAQAAAIALREPAIAEGDPDQFWRGDKEWQTFGALALLGGDTGLPLLSGQAANATSLVSIQAQRNDYPSSQVAVAMQQYGASAAGTILTGLNAANAGVLLFNGDTLAVIKTNNAAPLVFGTNNIERMRLKLGLNVGGVGDPGAGCITCYDTMSTAHFTGTDLVLSGGATLGDDLILSGGGANLTVGGNGTVAGALTVTSTLTAVANLVAGGNLAVSGAIVSFTALPTSDPGVVGRLWRSGADVKVSI